MALRRWLLLAATVRSVVGDYVQYSTEPGIFQYENSSVNANPPDFIQTALGLVSRAYPSDSNPGAGTQWTRFAAYVASLNRAAASNTSYKVLYLGRTGETWDEVAETHYGKQCFDCFHAHYASNESVWWADPSLTPKGASQSARAFGFWLSAAPRIGVPMPDVFWSSPLYAALQTVNGTFLSAGGNIAGVNKPVYTAEDLRAPLTQCTCTWRRPQSEAAEKFPRITFDPLKADDDALWKANSTETDTTVQTRVLRFLDYIWRGRNNETYISVTSHAALFKVLLRSVKFPNAELRIPPGQVVAVLVRGEWVKGIGLRNQTVEARVPVEWCAECGPGSLEFAPDARFEETRRLLSWKGGIEHEI